jgi:hypothetical protein
MENKKEIIAFKCKACGELLDQGLCGDHRIETDHDDFEPVYK